MIRTTTLCAVLVLCTTLAANAEHKHNKSKTRDPGRVSIENSWARASASANAAGAAYFVIRNTGNTTVRLVTASTPVARRAELHSHLMDKNVMRMRKVGTVAIEPGESLTLKPGGHHIMLTGLKKKLVKGDVFPLTLGFEKVGELTVNVSVGSIAAMGPQGHGPKSGGMKMNMKPGGMKMDHGKH